MCQIDDPTYKHEVGRSRPHRTTCEFNCPRAIVQPDELVRYMNPYTDLNICTACTRVGRLGEPARAAIAARDRALAAARTQAQEQAQAQAPGAAPAPAPSRQAGAQAAAPAQGPAGRAQGNAPRVPVQDLDAFLRRPRYMGYNGVLVHLNATQQQNR